eukprot:1547135-Rhodomonas_salina.1
MQARGAYRFARGKPSLAAPPTPDEAMHSDDSDYDSDFEGVPARLPDGDTKKIKAAFGYVADHVKPRTSAIECKEATALAKTVLPSANDPESKGRVKGTVKRRKSQQHRYDASKAEASDSDDDGEDDESEDDDPTMGGFIVPSSDEDNDTGHAGDDHDDSDDPPLRHRKRRRNRHRRLKPV